jgi:hypothetical protein
MQLVTVPHDALVRVLDYLQPSEEADAAREGDAGHIAVDLRLLREAATVKAPTIDHPRLGRMLADAVAYRQISQSSGCMGCEDCESNIRRQTTEYEDLVKSLDPWPLRAAIARGLPDADAITYAEPFGYCPDPTIGGPTAYWAHQPIDAHEARHYLARGGTYNALPPTPDELFEAVRERNARLDAGFTPEGC